MKVKITITITKESEIAFWRRKGVVGERVFVPRAEKERDRYASDKHFQLIGRGNKKGKQ